MSTAQILLRRSTPRHHLRSLPVNAGAVLRHARARLWAASTSPTVLGLLLLGGLTVVPLWWSMSGWSVALAGNRAPSRLLIRIPDMLAMFLWVPLVVAAASGTVLAIPSRGSTTGRSAPTLPIGPRSRAVADTLVVLVLLVVARTIGLASGLGFRPPEMGPLEETWRGLALVVPLVISWAAVPRLDGPGLLGPGLVMCALPLVLLVGGGATSLLVATAVSAALSALVLAAVGVEVQVEDPRAEDAARSLSFCSSPGPAARLRRERWTGPLRRLGILVGPLVLLIGVVEARSGLLAGPSRPLELLCGLLGLLALTMVVFHPFGLRVASSSGPGLGTLWNGYFGRAWSLLPVPRRDVLLSVYAHGWVVGLGLWLLFCGWVYGTIGFDGRAGFVTIGFELAGVPLAAGVLLCATVGDGRRGTLALCALVAFQIVVPMGPPLARDAGLDAFRSVELRAIVTLTGAWLLALLGGLPPLVHLRGRSSA